VTASYDTTARVWDGKTGAEVAVLRGHRGAVVWAGWNGAGTRIATASADGTARVWEAASGEEVESLEGHDGAVFGAAWSPDGARLLTWGRMERRRSGP